MESDCPPGHCCLVVVEDSSKDDLIKSLRSEIVYLMQKLSEKEERNKELTKHSEPEQQNITMVYNNQGYTLVEKSKPTH